MRILTNERRIQRGRFLATSLSISGLLMLLSSWIGVVFFLQTIGYSTLPLLPLGMIFSLIGIHHTRKWVRLPLPHQAISTALKGIGKEALLLNYWGAANHILLTRHGVFALTSRNQPFDLHIDGSRITDRAPLRERLQRAFARDGIGNPLRDAQRDADKASKWLTKLLGKEVAVQPLIVFLNANTHLQVDAQPQIPFVYADKRTPTLKTFLKTEQSSMLTDADIDTVVSNLTVA